MRLQDAAVGIDERACGDQDELHDPGAFTP
jgi:hypothetical protein